MKFIFLLIVFLSFPVKTIAQSNDPLDPERTSYDKCGVNVINFPMLPVEAYPWGVCFFEKHDEYSYLLSEQERIWAREAMERWNTKYINYLWRRFKTYDVVNIPSGKLFVESCDSDLHNIIYVGKKPLGKMAGYYSPRDSMWDFVYFHGFIVINSDQNWTREHFINVLKHELGHANKTEIYGFTKGKWEDMNDEIRSFI